MPIKVPTDNMPNVFIIRACGLDLLVISSRLTKKLVVIEGISAHGR